MRFQLVVVAAALAAALSLAPSPASASDGVWAPSVGTRIGGYGFRTAAGSDLEWDECRMNGVGGLVRLDRVAPWYLQFSLDGYHATADALAEGMDRLSLLPGAAIGVRFDNRTPLLPHVELGLGAELTRVTLDADTATRLLPTAYFGTGVEVVVRQFAFGTTIRANAMGLPDHAEESPAATTKDRGGNSSDAITFRPEVAGQVTFSFRYSF